MGVYKEKRKAVKRLVFQSDGISRREISAELDIDVRTINGYLEELANRGLLITRSRLRTRRGRPTILYYPNNDNILYPGIFVSSKGIRGVLVDLDGNEHLEEIEEFFSIESKLTFFNKVLKHCAKLVRETRGNGKIVGGIGVAYSRWLQPPLSEFDVFSALFEALAAEFYVPIYTETPINALLYKIKNLNGCGDNIGIVHAGNILEMGVMLSNSIPDDLEELENSLRHFEAFPGGEKCYCGKVGCLENAVTTGGILHAFNNLSDRAAIKDIRGFNRLLDKGDIAALNLLDSLADGFASALKDLCRKLRLSRIYFCTSGNEMLFEKTAERFNSEVSENDSVLLEVPIDRMSVPKAAGNMAAYLTVRHHMLFE